MAPVHDAVLRDWIGDRTHPALARHADQWPARVRCCARGGADSGRDRAAEVVSGVSPRFCRGKHIIERFESHNDFLYRTDYEQYDNFCGHKLANIHLLVEHEVTANEQ